MKRHCHFVIFVSFCFSCDSGNICRSVNIPKNAGKLTLITATWLMHCCDLYYIFIYLFLFNPLFSFIFIYFDQLAGCHLLIAHHGPGLIGSLISHPDAPLSVWVRVFLVRDWASLGWFAWCHGDGSFMDFWRGAQKHMPAFFDVCPPHLLHSLSHKSSKPLNHLLTMSDLTLLILRVSSFFFSYWSRLMHASRPALCILSSKSWIRLCILCLFSFGNSWYAITRIEQRIISSL